MRGTIEDVRRLVVGPDAVAAVLPEALADTAAKRPQSMEVALEPIVTDTVRVFARREPEVFGELLAPMIGTAVRSAVAAAIKELMERLNHVLERSLSVQSMQWRLEAARTGRPFAEVVLAHTLIYRVEQIFLLHVPTGLVLQHVVAEEAPSADPDQVASMLSALDAFAREALESAPGVHLRQLAIGDLTLQLNWDANIAVVAVTRGAAPMQLSELLRETRERVYLAHREDLATFMSDVTPFARARPTLEECLGEQLREPPHRAHIVLAAFTALVLLAGLAYVVMTRAKEAAQQHRLAQYRTALASEPGIKLMSAEHTQGRYRLAGLFDPLATDPAAVLAQRGLPPAELSFSPFESLDPVLVERKVRSALQPPAGVELTLMADVVHLAGEAPAAWIEHASLIAHALPGVARVDVQELRPSEELGPLRALARDLRALEIGFALGSAVVRDNERPALDRAARVIETLQNRAAPTRLTACVTVVGQADATGSTAINQRLIAARARAVVAALERRGVGKIAAASEHDPGTPQARFLVELVPRSIGGCGSPP